MKDQKAFEKSVTEKIKRGGGEFGWTEFLKLELGPREVRGRAKVREEEI